jgi:putative FmdB family regulatory protein
MPNYEYLCNSCSHNFQIVESIKAESQSICPICKANSLHRVIHAAQVFTKEDPKTIGHQADRNVSKMGKYELEAKRYHHAEAGNRARKMSGRKPRPKAERPFWRKTDKVDTELAKLAPNITIKDKKIVKSDPLSAKAVDYIMTGKK